MTKTTKSGNKSIPDEYGVLHQPNIKSVIFGNYEISPWYGNAALFSDKTAKRHLGIEHSEIHHLSDQFWLDTLYVCEYCFKYTGNSGKLDFHRVACKYRTEKPQIGSLVYWDEDSPYIIRHIQGDDHSLFCQNLSLFGKFFLDDKSVFYNVNQFEYYVVYGYDKEDPQEPSSRFFKPMGFFSKEMVSWDGDINLSCICVFPPFQRRHLGSLLIEFSYAVSRASGLSFTGPEFPLSTFGKASYLRLWSQKIARILLTSKDFTIRDLAVLTGFRKEDVWLTLEYMKVLDFSKSLAVCRPELISFCERNGIDADQERSMLKEDCVLL